MGSKRFEIQRIENGHRSLTTDLLTIEEPLEIRVEWFTKNGTWATKPLSVTMRTPGSDFELAAGFLLSEGIVRSYQSAKDQIEDIAYCNTEVLTSTEAGQQKAPSVGLENVVKVRLKRGTSLNLPSLERNFFTTSSCGICGKASISALREWQESGGGNLKRGQSISASKLSALPLSLRSAQESFAQTGGLHAAGLFHFSGELITIREDVGRHNAVDKLLGWAFLQAFETRNLSLAQSILVLSGRVSFELVQKASFAGVPMIVAVGAPSSLAIELAQDLGMTVVGFTREQRFNIYCGHERVALSDQAVVSE